MRHNAIESACKTQTSKVVKVLEARVEVSICAKSLDFVPVRVVEVRVDTEHARQNLAKHSFEVLWKSTDSLQFQIRLERKKEIFSRDIFILNW